MLRSLVFVAVLSLASLSANAQVIVNNANNNTPFYNNGGVVAYRPQIDVVSSGVLHSVQATVSADRKYVTLTATPQLSNVVSIQSFAFQTTGPVGGNGNANNNNNNNNNGNNNKANNNANNANPPVNANNVAPRAVPLLERPGMVKLAD